MDKKIVDREMKSHIRSDIGDIRVELIRDDDTSEYDADRVLRTAVEFWRTVELKGKNLPSPSP